MQKLHYLPYLQSKILAVLHKASACISSLVFCVPSSVSYAPTNQAYSPFLGSALCVPTSVLLPSVILLHFGMHSAASNINPNQQ